MSTFGPLGVWPVRGNRTVAVAALLLLGRCGGGGQRGPHVVDEDEALLVERQVLVVDVHGTFWLEAAHQQLQAGSG